MKKKKEEEVDEKEEKDADKKEEDKIMVSKVCGNKFNFLCNYSLLHAPLTDK